MTTSLGVNVFTAPEKTIVGERPKPFGPTMAWDPLTSTLIVDETDAVLVDTQPPGVVDVRAAPVAAPRLTSAGSPSRPGVRSTAAIPAVV